MSMSEGPFPWSNFGDTDRSANPDSDSPIRHLPLLPPMPPDLEPTLELDLTAEDAAQVQPNTENDSNDLSGDFNYSISGSALDPVMQSVLDSVIASVETMDRDLVSVPDVMQPTVDEDWTTELPNLSLEPTPELPAARLEDVIAQIDAEMAANAQVEDSIAIERRAAAIQTKKHIMFSLAGAKYAMPLGQVIEISRAPRLMPLPNVPEWLLGVTNLRGDIISVVDLHAFLGLPYDTRNDASRMCVVRAEQHELVTGLMVDRVDGLASLATESFGGPSASMEGNINQYLQGVGEHDEQLLRVLDLDTLLQAFDLSG